ncbi:hypothetical protein OVY01_06955 [Robbsia sp. Bb-Pol-6]|uniref:Uncharacterized protein n=1 Tax=Robbsia betulipollinis TaxID=2981849 RepID=A0ABT3ZM02_9BURK|nr:hypothetical protein [Robbsia betulipollinis]MCY0386975.1 hypothetical protein [Robbsia betulipollinis]
MQIVFTMSARMIAIVSVCALVLCIVVFIAGMQVGACLDVHVGHAGPAGASAVATGSASSMAAWPAAPASDTSSINHSGE